MTDRMAEYFAPKAEEAEDSPRWPEIIANPPLENLSLVYSIPTFKEWGNGNLLRNAQAVMSQKTPGKSTIEVNYVVNNGMYFEDTPREILEDTEKSLKFLRSVVEVQKTARLLHSAQKNRAVLRARDIQAELDALLKKETDVAVRDVLLLAAEKADNVAVSGLNVPDNTDLINNGYRVGDDISVFRTVGMDYAAERLSDSNGVILFFDADTVPATNHFTKDLLSIYEENPDLNFVFLGLGYLPPGTSKDLVSDSPRATASRIVGYNPGGPAGSPQISFRKRAVDSLQAIGPGDFGSEDYATAARLLAFFGSMQNGILTQQAIFIPTSLTSDREGGFVDSAARMDELKKSGVRELDVVFDKAIDEEKQVYDDIAAMPEEMREKIKREMDELRKDYVKQQKMLLRFNRQVARSFLSSISKGDIAVTDKTVNINEANVLKEPCGKALLAYVKANKNLIASLSHEDRALIRYYIDKDVPFPASITSLTPFQSAIREYLGAYQEAPKEGLRELRTIGSQRSLEDKKSIYQGFVAEVLALGNIYTRYLYRKRGSQEIPWIEIDKRYPERSAWLQAGIPSEKMEEVQREGSLREFVANLLPFGPLVKIL